MPRMSVSLRTSYSIAPVCSFPRGWCGLDVKLTSRHHPFPRLRMSGIKCTLSGQAEANAPQVFFYLRIVVLTTEVKGGKLKKNWGESGVKGCTSMYIKDWFKSNLVLFLNWLLKLKFWYSWSILSPSASRVPSVISIRSQLSHGLTSGSQPLACWDCGFESRRGHGCLSLVSVVFCRVKVSASSVVCLSVISKPRR